MADSGGDSLEEENSEHAGGLKEACSDIQPVISRFIEHRSLLFLFLVHRRLA